VVNRGAFVLAVLALSLGLAEPGRAQSAAALEELKRQAIAHAREQEAQALAAQAQAAPVVDLSLDEAVQRALDRNLDIAVERLNPRTYDHSLSALYATYRPTLTSSFGNLNQVTLPNSQLTGVTDKLVTQRQSWAGGVSQNLRWGGGNISVSFDNSRTDSSNAFATRNPSFNTTLSATYVQPLLRNFRIDSTRAQLETTRIGQDISELQLRATITRTLASVRNAYFDLIAAREAVEVARQSLALASKLVADNKQRVEIGTLAPIDVIQAQAEEATRRQALVQAEQTARTAELALKRLIVSGTDDPLWHATINPVDRPGFSAQSIDIEAVVRNALENRTDLLQARKQLESNTISLRNLTNQTLPALDLTARYSLAGLGGTQYERKGLGGAVSAVYPSGYLDALANIRRFDAPTWNIQLNFSYPIGVSAAQANLARAKLQLEQTQAQMKALMLQIATEVTNIALQVRSNAQRVQAATAARELAQKRLEAEQSKFEVGLSTNFLVVQAQRDLADAQNAELRAILDYRKSLVDLERVQVAGGGSSVSTISAGGSTGATAAAAGGGTRTTGGGGGQ
jgi:outer membrane protein